MKRFKALAGNAAYILTRAVMPVAVISTAMLSTPTYAESTITVEADRAKIVNFVGEPAAIIIGNPTFADVTVRTGKLIVHGRHFGTTNLLILDDKGDQLANFELNVVQRPVQGIVMYKAGRRETYSCAPNCEVTLAVGDSSDYTKQVNEQINTKTSAATAAAKMAE